MEIYCIGKEWNDYPTQDVKAKYLVGESVNVDELLDFAGIDKKECLVLLEVTNSNVSITYKKLSRQQIYKHIRDMEDLADELPENTVEI